MSSKSLTKPTGTNNRKYIQGDTNLIMYKLRKQKRTILGRFEIEAYMYLREQRGNLACASDYGEYYTVGTKTSMHNAFYELLVRNSRYVMQRIGAKITVKKPKPIRVKHED
jgi:hypothetical protein